MLFAYSCDSLGRWLGGVVRVAPIWTCDFCRRDEDATRRATKLVVLDDNLDMADAKERIKHAYLSLCDDCAYPFERDGYRVRKIEAP